MRIPRPAITILALALTLTGCGTASEGTLTGSADERIDLCTDLYYNPDMSEYFDRDSVRRDCRQAEAEGRLNDKGGKTDEASS